MTMWTSVKSPKICIVYRCFIQQFLGVFFLFFLASLIALVDTSIFSYLNMFCFYYYQNFSASIFCAILRDPVDSGNVRKYHTLVFLLEFNNFVLLMLVDIAINSSDKTVASGEDPPMSVQDYSETINRPF